MVCRSPAAFAAAIRAHVLDTVALDAGSVERIRAPLAGGGVLLVGEPHGVRETPSVLYALANALDVGTIAFEWSHDEVDDVVQSFVRTGTLDLERLWSLPEPAEALCGDGRVTAGHFALLRRLREEGRLDGVILFDRLDPEPPLDDWRVRDREMAERLLEEWNRKGVVLAAAGALHAQVELRGTFAHELAQTVPVHTAVIAYAAGSYWSRGVEHELPGTIPDAETRLPVASATPAVVPGR